MQHWAAVTAASQPDPNDAHSHGHLGDLLQAASTRAPEHEWVGLVRAIGRGDESALRELYDRTHRLVYTFTARMTGCHETAEELTVDVYYDVWKRASAYDLADGSLVGWIMNLARSRAVDRLRFDGRQKRSPGATHAQSCDLAAPESRDALGIEEHRQTLQEALARLTPEERQAIETAYFAEISYSAAARRLDVPEGTIKTRIRMGLAKLRHLLNRRETS